MVSTASTNALPMNCPWRNKLSPSPRPRRGVHIVKVCPVDNIYLLCYTATCLSSIAGAGYSSPFPSHQGVHTRWFGSAPRWQRGGHGFEPRMLHLESTVSAVLFLCVHKVAAAETGPVIYKIKDAEAAQAASSFFTQKCNKVDTIYKTAAKERQEVTYEKQFLKNIRIPGICP